jgi:hypothetical protein
MSKYMFLLYQDPSRYQNLSAEEMQKMTEKYMAWTQKPFVTDSKRLASDHGRVIRAQNGQPRATDGPYSETKEVLAGYYTIEAPSYDEAVRLAIEHPHLANGGTIEVRHVFGT